MTPAMEQWSTRRLVLFTLTVGTVLYLVFYVPGAVAYFVGRVWDLVIILVFAAALTVLLTPPVELLCRLKLPLPDRAKRMIATLLVLAVLVGVTWLLLSLTATQLLHEVHRIVAIGKTWLARVPGQMQQWLTAQTEQAPPEVVAKATDTVAQWTQTLLQYQFDFAKSALLRGWYLVELLVVPILAFYFVVDAEVLRRGCLLFSPARYRAFASAVADDVGVMLNAYVRAQVALCLTIGIVVGIILYLNGVSMYLTLAIIAGVCRMAPVVGPIIAAVPCVGVPLLQNGPHTGLVVLACYCVLIFLDGKLLSPILLGSSATLHPVVIILSLLLGYEFMGVLGLLVAVPVAGIVRATYARYRLTFGDPDNDPGAPAVADGS